MTPLDDAVLILKLVAGVHAVQPPRTHISTPRAALYARAAAYHGKQRGIDPFELLALARNESGFYDQAVGPDGLDCGVTQTRIIYSKYTCDQLKRSAWLGFGEAAREMAAYNESCRSKGDYDRCRLNRYNSGVRYARRGFHGRYYLRVRCWAEAARNGIRVDEQCRTVRSEDEVALLLQSAALAQGRELPPAFVREGSQPALAPDGSPMTAPGLSPAQAPAMAPVMSIDAGPLAMTVQPAVSLPSPAFAGAAPERICPLPPRSLPPTWARRMQAHAPRPVRSDALRLGVRYTYRTPPVEGMELLVQGWL